MEQGGQVLGGESAVEADLGPYLPRFAITWANEAPDEMWRTIDASLVFADISGFTALSERLATRGNLGAEELTDVLGRCFAELLAVAYAEGGGLLKFGGDALLLLFDGPAHEVRASRAALGMRARLRSAGKLRTSVGSVQLRMSQGLHSGRLHLFRVGSSHKELLICGPGATATVAMESAASAGEIIVSPAAAKAIESMAPQLLGEVRGPGTLLRNKSLVHVVEGFPASPPAGAAAAAGVPVALRRHLAAGGDDSEHRHVSLAFVHFDGTDALLADRGPAAVATALHEVISVIQAAAAAEDVTFLATDIDADGGKVILVSGAPAAREDAEGGLLRCVRGILDAGTRLPVRVGVNRGHVFAGAIGPTYRRTYTVMGDAVNLTARLMAKARPGEVVVAPSVLEASRTHFTSTPLEPFSVKGKSALIRAALLGHARGTQETRSRGQSMLVARDAELARLLDAKAEGGCVVDVVGDVGLGKSRLIQELRSANPGEVRIVTCEPYERATPYFSIGVLLRHVLGLHGLSGDPAASLSAAMEQHAPELADWAPLIGDVMGVAGMETDATRHLQPQYRRERTNTVVASLLRRVLPHGTAVCFDDVQWIDDASREVLTHVALDLPNADWTLVVTRRPDGSGFEPGPSAISVMLRTLTEEEARSLVASATSGAPLPPPTVDAIVGRAGGNPLFLEELSRIARRSDGDDLPVSLEAVVATQVDSLAPPERRLLRYAAVLGESFDPALFGDVVSEPDLAHASAISTRLQGFVQPTHDGRAEFRHRLVRDVAYNALPFRLRQELHGRAAHAIERSAGDDTASRAEILSMHCFHAQQFEKCWSYATTAALRAREKFALVEAREHYERAISAARRVRADIGDEDLAAAFVGLGRVHQWAGRFEDADRAFHEGRKLFRDNPVKAAPICAYHANVANRLGNTSAIRWLMRGLRELEGISSDEAAEERAHLMTSIAWARLQSGKPRDAMRWCLDAIEEAQRASSKAALAQAYSLIDHVYLALGRPAEATFGRLALDLYRELEQHDALATQLLNLGVRCYMQGQWSEALELYEQSRKTFMAIGDYVDAAMGSCNIGEIFVDQARLTEADESFDDALSTWRSLGFDYGIAVATRHKARVALRRGDAVEAKGLFGASRDAFEAYGVQSKLIEIDTWLAECELATGGVAVASALLDSALEREVASGSTECRAMIHRLRSYAAAASSDIETAWAEADQSLAIARSRESAYDVALALQAMEVLTRLGGRLLEEDARRECAQLLDELGVRAAPTPPLALSSS